MADEKTLTIDRVNSPEPVQVIEAARIRGAVEANMQQLPANQQVALIQQATSRLEPEKQKDAAVRILKSLPKEEQDATVEEALGPPSNPVRDFVWKVAVLAFASVIIISTIALAVNVFYAPVKESTANQMILTLFTSAVGFLAGLFAPSPLSHK